MRDCNTQIAGRFRYVDLNDPRAGELAQLALCAVTVLGVDVLRGNRRMADKRYLMLGREEPHAQVVIIGFGVEHERRFYDVQFACDDLHLLVRQRIGIEHHRGRIAAEPRACECVDVEQAAGTIGHGNSNGYVLSRRSYGARARESQLG